MHARHYIYLTVGHWGVQAALDISNIQPLKVNGWLLRDGQAFNILLVISS